MVAFFSFLFYMMIVPGIISFIVFLVIYIYNRQDQKKCFEFLRHNSVAIKNLVEINKRYNFHTVNAKRNFTHTYDNEFSYNNITCQDFLIYQLQFQKYDIEWDIKLIYSNNKKYISYCSELSKLRFGEFINESEKINKNHLLNLEKKIVEEYKIVPTLDFEIDVTLNLSNRYGEIYEAKYYIFNSYEISNLIFRLKNKNGDFYNDREVWDSICRVERGRVSNKMRFAIYERDGYRCRCCGISQNRAYLEIDHIKPISKGGKSTYDNLQTLCRECNQEKGNIY